MDNGIAIAEKNENITKEELEPEILSLKEILEKNITIPDYQRPYKWKAHKHVKQLLEDIIRESSLNKEEYRIGTLILHKTIEKFEIVDGQQRLITISLILLVLDDLKMHHKNHLLSHEWNNEVSKNNIKYNYQFIDTFFRQMNEAEKLKVQEFIYNKITFAVIPQKELSIAFQLFDSQNSRGKTLNPVDLLKAFHLREMRENTEKEKKNCVTKWEKAINDGLLIPVIEKYLFRLRQWKRKEWGYYFSNDELDEFKGISLIQSLKDGRNYPFIALAMQKSLSTNFEIDEPIVNGKRFFEYVNHYIGNYQDINHFTANKNSQLIFEYPGAGRIGDRRLKTLYKKMLFAYIDKFGFDSEFQKIAQELYRWVFSVRLKKTQIRYQTILNLFKKHSDTPLTIIQKWYLPNTLEIRTLNGKIGNDYHIVKSVPEIEKCIESIENQ